ncbi:MAG: hypothetical protein D3913_06935 [Candidatus Electrothrix sp. LOE1_4_5]|nr:hypothetical protein [Candidatus Electrothrix gigas]
MPETTAEQLAELISGYTDLKKYFESVRAEMNQRLDEMAEIIEGKRLIPQEDWQTPELQNGWKTHSNAYNSPGYFKDNLGIVHLKGLIRAGTDKLILTLPEGYRPELSELQVTCTRKNNDPNINDDYGRIDILPDGDVIMEKGVKEWVSLDGITFRAK